MKKNGFRGLISLLVLSVTIVSCSDKESLTPTITPPSASGIVILSNDQHVVKGQEFSILLRVNPSGAVIDKNSIEFDAFLSDTYMYISPDSMKAHNSTKASYVTPTELFECVSLTLDSSAVKEPLEGQWRLRVKTKGEGNFMNKSSLYLVLNYLDDNGKKQRISSTLPIYVQIYPTLEEGLTIGYAKGQTFRAASDNAILPYIVLVNCNAYQNKNKESWYYERKLVTGVEVSTADSVFKIDQKFNDGYLSFTPLKIDRWNDFEKSEAISISTDINVVFTDISKAERKVMVPSVYYRMSRLTMPFTFSAAKVNATPEISNFAVDVNSEMAKLGYTPDFNVDLYSMDINSDAEVGLSTDIFCKPFEISGASHGESLSLKAQFAKFKKTVKPGTTPPDKISIISTSFSITPQNTNFMEAKFRLLDTKVAMPITITE